MDRVVLSACVVDLERRVVRGSDGREEALTEHEQALLRYLAERPGRTVTREELLERVWGYSAKVVTRAVDVAVRRLRQKIEVDPSEPLHVLSVRGVGYRFEGPEAARDLPASPPPARIPHERSSFVGRARELEELERWLDDGARVVTLVGAPGVGKSRLGARLAHRRAAGGEVVTWAELAPAATAGTLLRRVADALGVPVEAGAADDATAAQLGLALQARGRVLLVLDDAEHLVDALARAVAAWLAEAGEVRIVVTSRERLRVSGERVLIVAALPPDDAVVLFLERAAAVRAGWGAGQEQLVERIVARLDHNPLALELAAARAEILPPPALLDAIEERFRLLAMPGRDATLRQGTLWAAIESSWSLLSGWERAALAQLAVFEGGFTVDAAAEVVDLRAHPDAPWVLDQAHALVGRSLLAVIDGPTPRFRLAESIREFAVEKAASLGLLASARDRHARFFEAHATALAARCRGLEARQARSALGADLGNVRAALGHAAERGDPDLAARLAIAADALLETRGPVDERLAVLDTALVASPSPGLAGALLAARAWAKLLGGDREGALDDAEGARNTLRDGGNDGLRREVLLVLAEAHRRSDRGQSKGLAALCVDEAREAGDLRRETLGLRLLARLHYEDGERDAHGRALDRMVAAAEASGDPALLGSALMQQGFRARTRGQGEEARAWYERALAVAEGVGDRRRMALVEGSLGALRAWYGALEPALHHYLRCRALNTEDGYRRSAMFATSNAGMIAMLLGREAEAERLIDEALADARALGTPDALGMRLANRGLLHRVRGAVAAARLDLEAALAAIARSEERFSHAYFSTHAASACADLGDAAAARRHLDAADPLLGEDGTRLYVVVALGHLALADGDRQAAAAHLEQARALRMSEGPAGPLTRSVLPTEADLALTLLADRLR